jgi:pilus assembly protein CpaB
VKKKMPLLLALIFGFLAAGLTWMYLQKQNTSAGETRSYLVASKKIIRGNKFSGGNMAIKQIPAKYAPLHGILSSDKANAVGLTSVVDIPAGQVLLWEYLESGMGEGGLSSLLIQGERAITIPVDAISGMDGMIKANDYVDILGTFSISDGARQKTITRILNQGVTVLSVGNRNRSSGDGAYGTITLKVTPQEAEVLTFAEGHGKLRLILRGRKDLQIDDNLPAVDFSNILQLEEKNTSKKAANMPKVIYN